jgi:hypothetical protein
VGERRQIVKPAMLQLVGNPRREKHRLGRADMLSTPFEMFEAERRS